MAAVNNGLGERLHARNNPTKQSMIKAPDIQDCRAIEARTHP
jgi:hypothetical protein